MQAVGYKFGQGGVPAPTLALFKSSVGALKMTIKRICKIDNCDKPVKSRGWCNMHYLRSRSGVNMFAAPKTPDGTGAAWIEAHKGYHGDDCLPWPFATMGGGYGWVKFQSISTTASRAMCIAAHGNPPSPEFDAAHSCGNGHLGCVNPKHLRWATRVENMADMIGHGTALRGNDVPAARLTESQVREIMAMKGRALQGDIAEMFGVSRPTISCIHNKKTWCYLWEQ